MSTEINYRVDPLTVFPEVEALIYDVCWQFTRMYPISFEECRSEAYSAFMKSTMDYVPERGMKYATWARYWVWCKLKDLVMKRSGERITFMEDIEEDALTAQPTHSPSLELIAGLGEDAKTIVALFLHSPAEILEDCTTAHKLVRNVKRFLVKKEKWQPSRFETAFRSMRQTFQESWA